MGSWRLVAVVAAIGVALWGLAVWVSHRQPEHSVDVAHRLVELSELDVASIAIERDGNSLAATFTRPESVTIASSDGRPLVAAATASFFAALENTYTRRLLTGEPETERVRLGTEPGRASLTIVSNLKVTQILRLGTMVADGEVTWVSREQDGRVDLALISTTEAEGLFLPPPLWVERRVFAEVGEIESIEIRSGDASAKFAGTPLAWVSGFSSVRLDPGVLQKAVDELRKLVVVGDVGALGDGPDVPLEPDQPTDVLEIKLRSSHSELTVRVGGQGCGPSHRATISVGSPNRGPARDVCVEGEAIETWRRIAEQPQQLVLAGVLRTGVAVERFVLTRISGSLAEEPLKVETKGDGDLAASEFLADVASASAGPSLKRTDLESSGPLVVRARLDLEFRGGDSDRVMVSERSGRFFLSLAGQPLVWPLDGERAKRVLAVQKESFRFRGLIRRDPTELRRITLNSRAGSKSWSFELGRGWQPVLVEGVASAISNLSAMRFEPSVTRAKAGLTKPRRQLSVVFAPAPIASQSPDALWISVGRKIKGGCYAEIVAGATSATPIAPIAVIDEATCDQWLAL